MKAIAHLKGSLIFLLIISCLKGFSQAPVANFSLSSVVLCTGVTYTLTDLSTNNPTSWTYTVDDGFSPLTILTAQNPTVSFVYPTSFTISLESANPSGVSAPYSEIVFADFTPGTTITPQSEITCLNGSPINISIVDQFGGGSGFLSYQWSNGSTTSSINVTPTVTTVYSCVITEPSGNCPETKSCTITIGNASVNVTASHSMICSGGLSILSATGTGPEPKTFIWPNNVSGPVYTTSEPGKITVAMVNGLGCTATRTFAIVNGCVGLEELSSDNKLSIYPNPCHGVVTLKSETNVNAQIYDISGRQIRLIALEGGVEQNLVTTDMAKGVYIVRVGTAGVQKLIVD